MKKLTIIAVLVALAASASHSTRADTVGFTTGGGTINSTSNNTLGYTFTLANPVSITQLGYWDYQANGLLAPVPVTIWDSGGVALATATLPSGTTAGEINQYLYATLATPVTLAAGTYTIGGYVSNINDIWQYNVNPITGATGITYGQPRFSGGNAYPTTNNFGGGQGYFGPNFQFNIVPEPSTWALLVAGAVIAGVVTIRRRRITA